MHTLTQAIRELQEAVRKYSSGNLKHLSKSGVFMPVLFPKVQPPAELMRLVDDINWEVSRLTSFELFALAIESVAKFATLPDGSRNCSWLHGGNFFIEIDKFPPIRVDHEMVTSAVHRWGVRNNKTLLLKESASPIQLENVISVAMQLDMWSTGISIHNVHKWYWLVDDNDKIVDVSYAEGGECCPDFSCCNGKPGWDLKQRKIFMRADEATRMNMCMMALQELAIDSGNNIHVAGTTTHRIN